MNRLLSILTSIALLLSGCTTGPKPPTSGLTIELNTAAPAEFDRIVGMGPVLASRIVKARGIRKFDDCGDLVTRVPGIGSLGAKKFSESGLRVNGESC
jgi:DNA uptake protein ComE-like DNA-binding protein